MGLENANVVANFFCDTKQIVGRMDIGGDAEVGALYRDQAEEVGGERGRIRLFGAGGEGKRETRMLFGGHWKVGCG